MENYDRLIVLGLVFTLAIFVALGLYWLNEPARMETVAAQGKAERVERGEKLYAENCASCHGSHGQGVPNLGSALNTQEFLKAAHDEAIFDTISDGRPNTAMPAWGQEHGGPFTAEEIGDLVAFIRSWEATAPAIAVLPLKGDPAQGAVLFSTTCYACHGLNGEGTNVAPALNSPELLARYGDDYFRETITQGRPSRGMPTWGKVLSPAQIEDLVVYLRSWESATPVAQVPYLGGDPVKGAALFSVTCVVCHGENGEGTDKAPPLNRPDFLSTTDDAKLYDMIAEGRLNRGMPRWGQVLGTAEIGDVVAFIRNWQPVEVTPVARGDVANGARLYTGGCAACHGTGGEGGVGPALRNSDFVSSSDDKKLRRVIIEGLPGTGMPPWEGDLSQSDVRDLIALLRSWQGVAPAVATPTSKLTPVAGSLEEGTRLYATHCAACHGAEGQGGIGSPLKGSAFLPGQSDAELSQIIRVGRAGTAMPGFADKLDDQEINNLLALLRSWQR